MNKLIAFNQEGRDPETFQKIYNSKYIVLQSGGGFAHTILIPNFIRSMKNKKEYLQSEIKKTIIWKKKFFCKSLTSHGDHICNI